MDTLVRIKHLVIPGGLVPGTGLSAMDPHSDIYVPESRLHYFDFYASVLGTPES